MKKIKTNKNNKKAKTYGEDKEYIKSLISNEIVNDLFIINKTKNSNIKI